MHDDDWPATCKLNLTFLLFIERGRGERERARERERETETETETERAMLYTILDINIIYIYIYMHICIQKNREHVIKCVLERQIDACMSHGGRSYKAIPSGRDG